MCSSLVTTGENLIGAGRHWDRSICGGLSPEREKALNIALNKIRGDWDLPKLGELLKNLDDGLKDIAAFDAEEIDEILGFKEEGQEDDFDEEAPEEPITQPGTSGY